ncbi:unnamed protein product [Ostreobium quekettii]|uniref:Peptidase S1 domain-containing protein n=1 Tax=Ostreobium quekettii TaxID=121088 RepID=A0A8S1IY65_9CHLO|nr:unnamed protein product [Ostreobium quekettii]
MGQHQCILGRGRSTYSAAAFTKRLCYLSVALAAILGSACGDGTCIQSVPGGLASTGGSGLGVPGSKSSIEEGESAPQDGFPYMASFKSTIGHIHVCGGTLIDPLYVLTAAHCIEKTGMTPFVHIGAQGLNDDEHTPGVVVMIVEEMIPHPKWSGETSSGPDIALARLSQSVPNASWPLWHHSLATSVLQSNLFTLGWGHHVGRHKGFGPPVDFTLQMADDLRIVDSHYCMNGLKAQGDSILCVSGRGRRACKGDSGGPLLLFDGWPSAMEETALHGVLMGVTSRADNCFQDGQNDSAVLYTRVASFLQWIQEAMASTSLADKEDRLEGSVVSKTWITEEDRSLQTELILIDTQQPNSMIPLSDEESKASATEDVPHAPTLREILDQLKLWMAANMGADAIKDILVSTGITLLVLLVGALATIFWGYPYLRHRLGSERAARRSALHTAVMEPEGDGEHSIEHLMRVGAHVDVNERDQAGRTPLHYAKSKTVARSLLDHDAQVDAADNQNLTPLHRACSRTRGGTDLVTTLLEAGADVNAKSNWDYTPLHMACFHGNVKVVKILLDWKAGVLHRNHVGYSALHEAAFNGDLRVAELLLEHGADASMDQVAQGTMHLPGGTPIDVAWARGNKEMAETLARRR